MRSAQKMHAPTREQRYRFFVIDEWSSFVLVRTENHIGRTKSQHFHLGGAVNIHKRSSKHTQTFWASAWAAQSNTPKLFRLLAEGRNLKNKLVHIDIHIKICIELSFGQHEFIASRPCLLRKNVLYTIDFCIRSWGDACFFVRPFGQNPYPLLDQ